MENDYERRKVVIIHANVTYLTSQQIQVTVTVLRIINDYSLLPYT